MFPVEFGGEIHRGVNRVIGLGLSQSGDRMIVTQVILTQCHRVTDRRTDRQRDGFTRASTALCIASYTDAL